MLTRHTIALPFTFASVSSSMALLQTITLLIESFSSVTLWALQVSLFVREPVASPLSPLAGPILASDYYQPMFYPYS
jgi:hypothetical protein